MAATPRRVTITSPRTTAARRRRTPVTKEIDAQTGVGDAFMASLVRSQLRLALLVLAVLGAVVVALPLLFTLVPGVRDASIGGIPLPWVVLGFLVYPVLLALGWFYVRQAERTEHDFSELVERE
jgi:hypothetical protein